MTILRSSWFMPVVKMAIAENSTEVVTVSANLKKLFGIEAANARGKIGAIIVAGRTLNTTAVMNF